MDSKGQKIGLALSGGGYRAAAYHIGTLRALRKLGILDKVDVISSVSGGSITAAYYALHKDNFDEFEQILREKLQYGVLLGTIICLIIEACLLVGAHGWLIALIVENKSLCVGWKCTFIIGISIVVLIFILLLLHKVVPTSRLIRLIYALKFFKCKTLSDLPDYPILSINATDVEQNRVMSFSQIKVEAGDKYKNGYFKKDKIPLSLAVMASSAYPLFKPVQIPQQYLSLEDSKSPILVDGGIYDNQGAHKLTEKGDYHADNIIVSDAGNTEMNRKGTWNVASLLYKIINLMMNRIDKMQRREYLYMQNKYDDMKQYPQYAYVVLEWLPTEESFISRFIDNVRFKKVPKFVCAAHGLEEELVSRIINGDAEACIIARDIVEKHIGWNELFRTQPDAKTINIAKGVGTNLFGLSEEKIDALISCAEWMTEVQCRLYLPNLIH